MTTAVQDGMIWMNTVFGAEIDRAIRGTPIPKALIIAIGIQETFYVWARIYKTSTPEQVLATCVGDSIDYPRRNSAWPKNRAELEAAPKGKAMFKMAREALERIATINSGYRKVVTNPDKFCHAFGMFQYDIQFFKTDPDFFLNGEWSTFGGTLGRGMAELTSAVRYLYGNDKASLTHKEAVFTGIAYNYGARRTKDGMATKGFRMGHKDDQGVYYGEHIDRFMNTAGALL